MRHRRPLPPWVPEGIMNFCRVHRWWGTDGRCPECKPRALGTQAWERTGVVDPGDPYDSQPLPALSWCDAAGHIKTERIQGEPVKLYELAPMYRLVAESLSALGEGDVPGPDREALEAQAILDLVGIGDAFDAKAENVALVVQELEVEAEAIQTEADRLRMRAQARANAAKRLKDYLKANMIQAGVTKTGGRLATVSLVNNGRPAITWERPLDDLPAEYRRVSVAMDGTRAFEALKADGCLPDGFTVVHGQHIRIR